MDKQLAEILKEYEGEKGAVIPVLQKVQKELGYLPGEAISEIARFLRMSETEVFGVASFYAQFKFTQCGKHSVKVCLGTTCHVRGGEYILDEVTRQLGIKPGETTSDYKFSLEKVSCFGSCALAPVVVVDKNVYGKVAATKVKDILAEY